MSRYLPAMLLGVSLLLCMPAFAQFDTGVISGKVTDPSGSVVPGAHLTIVQTETNFQSVSETDHDGIYRVPALPPGIYRVSAKADGFKSFAREGIDVRIGDNVGVDIKLEIGSTAESIDVTAETPVLDTQTSSTGQVMNGDYLYELPNLQHWEKGVMYYTPNVQSSNAPWPGSMGNWSINGGNANQIGYFEDGQLSTTMNGGNTMNSISVGDEEVKVLSTVLPAEYGHATTGAISVTKKAGSNTFHGSAGELYAPTSFNQRRFFALQTPQQQGVSDLFQEPDFVISGPVWIPKIYNGKNKTFFSVAGSYHVDHQSNASSYSVPTPAELGGNFNFTGIAANPIYDPASTSGTFAAGNLSRTPFSGNIIPPSRISAMWNNIMAVNGGKGPFSAPTSAGTPTPTGPSGNIIQDGVEHYYNLATQVRIDHQFAARFKMFASYIQDNNHQPEINPVIDYQPFDANQVYTPLLQDTGTVGFTYTISPSLISETRIGQYRQSNNPVSPAGDFEYAIAKTVPGLPSNVYLNPITLVNNTGIATEGTYGNGNLGTGTLTTAINTIYTFRQDFTKIKGTHAFKFGYEYMFEGYNSHNISNPRLSLTFGGTNGINNLGNTLPNTENTLADVMLGYVYSYSYSQQGQSLLPEDGIHSGYFQDDWRILPHLTLNLGVRYSSESPAHSKYPGGLSEGSLSVADDYYSQSIAGTVTCPAGGCVAGWIQPKGSLYNRDKDNFQPRAGFAWDIGHDTVIRGGYAIMTLDMNLWQTNQNEAGGANYLSTGTVTQPSNVYTPLFNINSGVPAPIYPTKQANGTIPTAGLPQNRGTLTVIPANFHNPYTQNWNFVIQHAIKKAYVVSLTYSGNHNTGFQGNYNWDSRPFGTGLDPNGNVINLGDPSELAYRNTWVSNATATQAYKPTPNWGGVNYVCNCISSVYHSGTIEVEKRPTHGLGFITFFTYQKGMQNAAGFGTENTYIPSNVGNGVTGITQKFRFTSSFTYDLPVGKGRAFLSHGRLLDTIFGGYTLSWNYSIWTPTPSGISYSGFSVINPATGALGSQQEYPNYEPSVGGNSYLLQDPSLRQNWQDIGTNRFVQSGQNSLIGNCGLLVSNVGNGCIVAAPSFTNGNLPQNEWISQRIIAANISTYKNFRIKERLTAQIRFDFFNPFKWFNWGAPSTALSNSNPAIFGTPGLNAESGASTEGGPPIMNLSFRVRF